MAVQPSNHNLSSPCRSPRRSSMAQSPKSTLSAPLISPSNSKKLRSSGSKTLSQSSSKPDSTTVAKQSWVWVHFKSITIDNHIKHVCQVELPSGATCGTHISPEKSSSTKNLIRHLNNTHQIFEGAIPETGIMQNFLARGALTYVSAWPGSFESGDQILTWYIQSCINPAWPNHSWLCESRSDDSDHSRGVAIHCDWITIFSKLCWTL